MTDYIIVKRLMYLNALKNENFGNTMLNKKVTFLINNYEEILLSKYKSEDLIKLIRENSNFLCHLEKELNRLEIISENFSLYEDLNLSDIENSKNDLFFEKTKNKSKNKGNHSKKQSWLFSLFKKKKKNDNKEKVKPAQAKASTKKVTNPIPEVKKKENKKENNNTKKKENTIQDSATKIQMKKNREKVEKTKISEDPRVKKMGKTETKNKKELSKAEKLAKKAEKNFGKEVGFKNFRESKKSRLSGYVEG